MDFDVARNPRFVKPFLVPPGKKISLARDYNPGYTDDLLDKEQGERLLQEGVEALTAYQDRLYAQNTYGVLVILQAMAGTGRADGPMDFEFNELGQWAFYDAGAEHGIVNSGDGVIELIEVEVRIAR